MSPTEKEAAILAEIDQIEAEIMDRDVRIQELTQMLDNEKDLRICANRVRLANLAALVTLEEGKF